MDKMTQAATQQAIRDDELLHRTYVEADQRMLDAVVPRYVSYEEDDQEQRPQRPHNVPERQPGGRR